MSAPSEPSQQSAAEPAGPLGAPASSIPPHLCPTCSYDLAGLALPGTCPECGTPCDAPRAPRERTLTEHASRGFAWMGLQAIGAKIVSTLGQIGIAYLLVREDFGLAAIANTAYSLAALLQQAGLRQVLVNRTKSFAVWATPAFGLSLTLGFAAAMLMAAAAPAMGWFYGDQRITWLVLILAPCMITEGALAVPLAKAQIDLRFKFLAFMNGVVTTAQVLSCLLFAALDLGAYAFALSVVVQALARVSLLWWFIRPKLRRRLHVRRWKHLFADSTLLLAASLVFCISTACGPLALGRIDSPEEVGLFTFALSLSLQTVLMVTLQLENVLFATLSKLKEEPLRQVRAFLRATGVLAVVVMPLCLLQAAAAEPAIRLIFPPKWYDAILPLQVLSVCMALFAATYSTNSLVQAQGRFGTFLKLAAFALITMVAFITACMLAWSWGEPHPGAGALWLSIAIGAQMVVYAFVALHRSIRPRSLTDPAATLDERPPGWPDVFRVLVVPFLISAAAIAPAWLLSRLLPDTIPGYIGQGAVIGLVSAPLYILLARTLMPQQWRELLQRLDPILRRIPVLRSLV